MEDPGPKPEIMERQPEQVLFGDVSLVISAMISYYVLFWKLLWQWFQAFLPFHTHVKEKTREQKEAELIPKVQEAVNYGLKVLESAFEQLDIKAGNSDSEDEEALEKVEPILEAKVKCFLRALEPLLDYYYTCN